MNQSQESKEFIQKLVSDGIALDAARKLWGKERRYRWEKANPDKMKESRRKQRAKLKASPELRAKAARCTENWRCRNLERVAAYARARRAKMTEEERDKYRQKRREYYHNKKDRILNSLICI